MYRQHCGHASCIVILKCQMMETRTNHNTLVMMLIGLVWATGTVNSCACIGTIIRPYQGMHPVCWNPSPLQAYMRMHIR